MTDVTTAPPPWSPVAAQSAPAQAVASQSGSSLSFLSGSRAPAGFGTRPEEMDEARRFSAALERAGNEPVQPVPAVTRLPLHTEQTAFSFGKPEEMDRTPPPASFEEDGTASAENDFFGEDGLTFSDFIDIINPLQHIPGVSTVYRSLTGDEISPGARMAGGTLYGGPIGFASALANTVVEETTGSDIAGNVMAALTGSDAPGAIGDPIGGTQTASLSAADIPTAQAQTAPVQTVPVQPEEVLALENIAPAGGTSPLFAAQPQGNGPIFAAQPTRQSPLADPNATATLAQAQIQAQQPAVPTVPPSSANTLSPQVHEALMQMAQESELQAQAQLQTQLQTQITPPTPPVAPAVTAPPAPPAPPTAPALPSSASSTATNSASSDGYIDPIAPQDLPNAMMEALARYEAMSQ